MGTPEFAVPSLNILVENNYNIVGVITSPDKPAGRGQQMHESAIKKYALSVGLPVLQPEKLKNSEFLAELKNLRADLQIVVAFRMLPELVWNMPPKGTFNLHSSLLPQYRGAAPINWAIINGEKETGVTTFFLQQEIDTGNILFQEKTAINADETAGELHDRLMQIGAQLVLKTVRAIENNSYSELPQKSLDPKTLKHAPKIFKDDCLVDWNQSVDEIHNFIRGLSPYPTAFSLFREQTLKIYQTKKEKIPPKEPPGTFLSDGKSYLKVACTDGYIHLLELQLQGKKRLSISDFLRGFRI